MAIKRKSIFGILYVTMMCIGFFNLNCSFEKRRVPVSPVEDTTVTMRWSVVHYETPDMGGGTEPLFSQERALMPARMIFNKKDSTVLFGNKSLDGYAITCKFRLHSNALWLFHLSIPNIANHGTSTFDTLRYDYTAKGDSCILQSNVYSLKTSPHGYLESRYAYFRTVCIFRKNME